MSRIEENKRLREHFINYRFKDQDNAAIVSTLLDIAESLAVIADSKSCPCHKEVDDGK